MSDVEIIVLILAVIYLSDCVRWTLLATVAFTSWGIGRSRLQFPNPLAGRGMRGLLWAQPLPPLGSFFLARPWPISASPETICSYIAQTFSPDGRPEQDAVCVAMDEIKTVRADGKKVFINDHLFLKTDADSFADATAVFVRKLQKAKLREREGLIEKQLAATLDADAVAQRVREYKQATLPLRIVSNLLFAHLLVLTPLLVLNGQFARYWQPTVVMGVGLLALTLLEFFRAHKRLYPDDRSSCWPHLIQMALAPPTAIRAHDVLAAPLLLGFHPLAVARVLSTPAAFRELAARVWRDAQHSMLPLVPMDNPALAAAESWSRQRWISALEKFLTRCEIKIEELNRPPMRESNESKSYCPRCLCQYLLAEGACRDCGQMPLRPFPKLGT